MIIDAGLMARLLALCGFVLATYLAIRFAAQPLLERHGFRQTQTALTAYWMIRDGFRLDYETPVVGFPWAIPFEFPLFQWLAALLCRSTGAPLDATGRFLSFAFLAACLLPARMIARRLRLGTLTRCAFVLLLFTSPQYLFWGRTFMIETAALFFSLLFIPFAIDVVRRENGWMAAAAACLAMTLALLVKSTTALPVLGVLGLLWLTSLKQRLPALRDLLLAVAAFVVPLLVGIAWVKFTDDVKQLNPIAASLTAQALGGWNFGTPAQRLSPQLWHDVVLVRGLGRNAGSALGGIVLFAALLWPAAFRTRATIASALGLYLLSLLMFTNLHIVHDYYQTSCTLFLIAALAVAIGEWLPQVTARPGLAVLAMSAAAIIDLIAFSSSGYAASMTNPIARHPTLAIADFVRRHVPPGETIVIYGQDWSSEIAYYAERRALTVPPWFHDYDRTWTSPGQFLGGAAPAASVICPSKAPPAPEQVNQRLEADPSLHTAVVAGCLILYHPDPSTPSADVPG